MEKSTTWQKIVHELNEFLVVFLFLAPFFASFATFRTYLAGGSRSALFQYGTSLVNALVLAKIILIGQIAGLGKRSENQPLIIPTLHKALMFTLLALVFHALEAMVHGLLHGQSFLDALHTVVVTEGGETVTLGLIMFFAFIPLFFLGEIRRVMGEEKFLHLALGVRPRHGEDSAVRGQTV